MTTKKELREQIELLRENRKLLINALEEDKKIPCEWEREYTFIDSYILYKTTCSHRVPVVFLSSYTFCPECGRKIEYVNKLKNP
jgi:hypothetical protein